MQHVLVTGGATGGCGRRGVLPWCRDGFTVREVIEHSRVVTNREVPITMGARRAGDAAALVCGSRRARTDLGWQAARSTMAQMIGDAWGSHQGPGLS